MRWAGRVLPSELGSPKGSRSPTQLSPTGSWSVMRLSSAMTYGLALAEALALTEEVTLGDGLAVGDAVGVAVGVGVPVGDRLGPGDAVGCRGRRRQEKDSGLAML